MARSFDMRLAALGLGMALIGAACETPKSAAPAASPGISSAAPVTDAGAALDARAGLASIRVESPYPGGIVVVNDSDAPVGIARALAVEREEHGAWTNVYGLQMQQRCFEPAPPECVTVAAHSRFEALPWTGWLGCSQCGSCRANAPAPVGRYRVVAVECAGGARHEGPAMELVGEGRFAGAPHVHAPKGTPDAIQIDNDSDVPMSFQTSVEVLALDKARGAWDVAPGAKMSLASACGADAGTCTTVPPRGSVTSTAYVHGCPPTTKSVLWAKPGTYMFRVAVCPGSKPLYNEVYGTHFTTEPFTVVAGGAVKSGE